MKPTHIRQLIGNYADFCVFFFTYFSFNHEIFMGGRLRADFYHEIV